MKPWFSRRWKRLLMCQELSNYDSDVNGIPYCSIVSALRSPDNLLKVWILCCDDSMWCCNLKSGIVRLWTRVLMIHLIFRTIQDYLLLFIHLVYLLIFCYFMALQHDVTIYFYVWCAFEYENFIFSCIVFYNTGMLDGGGVNNVVSELK